jgi:long-chain acyl-CoA synthetase
MPHFKTPLEAFLHWEKNTPETIFLKQPINRKVNTYTYKAAGEEIRNIAAGLIALDLPKKSHIALLSKNCAHWIMADLAIMMSGHISIPIYPTLNDKSINQILIHSDSKAIIIGKLDDFKSQKSGIPKIHKISIGLYGENEGLSWEGLLTSSKPLKEVHKQQKDDLITIIYTSGTTGNPKGVMHTVGNFTESGNTLNSLIEIKDNPTYFSYLPLAHIAERIGIGTCALLKGGTISFAESLETFAEDLERTQPHVFFAVPRIWTKFQEKILESIPQKRLNMILKIPILNAIFKKKIKHKLGLSDAKFICSAAAPISISSVKWFEKIGIVIEQGYGMTEDCVISHFNLPGNSKIGTVGKPLPNVLVKLSAEGEICIKNKCLMKGYYKAPDITAAVFDKYGFLKTGDIGEYDHDGFLTITGRVKDQFKTDKGKYISPAPIELQLSKNTDIEQICIVGTGIPQPIALITLSSLGKAKQKEELSKGLMETIDHINPTLEKHEKIEKIVIMKEDWNVDNGLTTPTLKVKRNSIEKIHQSMYKSWFETKNMVIFE